MTANPRNQLAYLSGRFILELDGHQTGIISSVDGGHFKSEAISEQVGGEGLVSRYPGRQKFEDITFALGSSMLPDFWKWVTDSIQANPSPSRRNGAILALDFDNRVRSRRTFWDALLAEIQFPALDLMSKGNKQITLKISPERMKFEQEDGHKHGAPPPNLGAQKFHLPSTFDFEIDGFNPNEMSWVTKIDAFTIKQAIINDPKGGLLYSPKEPGRVDYPALSIYTSESHVGPFLKWWEGFVGDGNHIHDHEKNGSINYRMSDQATDSINLGLKGLGITGLTFDKLEAGSDKVRNVKVDLYAETMEIKVRKPETVSK